MTRVHRSPRGPGAGRSPRRLVAAVLLGLAALLGSLGWYTPAQALPAPQATCSGIWVVVDYAALGGGSTIGCATTYTNGTTALRSAGYAVTLDAGMIVKINGLPTAPNTAQNYWSYWHATRQADGSYSGWSYSSLGANAFQPGPNDAEGWRYEPTNGGYVAPSVLPPKQVATTQAPPPPAPATTARTTAAPKTTTAAQAATTATTAGTAAAPSTSASPTDSPTPSASDSPTPSDTPADTATASPEPSSGPTSGGRSGATSSLLGGLGAIGAIAAGAGGVLWWRKRGLGAG
ncbi:MAG TPA: hypothetical protein VFK68_01910 [Propionibacteriaceae bacterium]|nr:hypothetical protein [Propionibacteriaceae bacterium]